MTGTGSIAAQDPQFDTPFIDVDEWRDEPVRHRYVHGGFEGTDTRFSFYFPPASATRDASSTRSCPCRASSTCGDHRGSSTASPGRSSSPSTAAPTWWSRTWVAPTRSPARTGRSPATGPAPPWPGTRRVLAAEMYGDHRPYGYIYGGSGGALQDDQLRRERPRRVGRRGAVRDGQPDEHARTCSRCRRTPCASCGTVPADHRRPRAGRQRRHVRRAHRRGARGAGRGDPDGLPAAGVVRRRAHRPGLHRRVVGPRPTTC